jgi:DNA-directed RNA polymerase specialized sigma24 family protein
VVGVGRRKGRVRMDLGEQLHALRAQRITFRQFYLATRHDWRHMAVALLKHWRVPPVVTRDDVEQELLLAAWKALPKWDPSRGTSLAGYVVWNAHDKATKWIHQQRGVERHTRKGPSRFAPCISSLVKDDHAFVRMLSSVESPADEYACDHQRILSLVPEAAGTELGRTAILRYLDAGGDVDRAARAWYGDPGQRYLFDLRSFEQARKVVREEVASVRKRVMQSEGGGVHV